jgi:hypothetical protein
MDMFDTAASAAMKFDIHIFLAVGYFAGVFMTEAGR